MSKSSQTSSMITLLLGLSLPLVGCVTADEFAEEPRPFGGSKMHPINVAGNQATVENCGDWSESVADTSSNEMAPNHGCAVQANIAAMAAYPQDLVKLRKISPAPAFNRLGALRELGDSGSSGLASTNAAGSGGGAAASKP